MLHRNECECPNFRSRDVPSSACQDLAFGLVGTFFLSLSLTVSLSLPPSFSLSRSNISPQEHRNEERWQRRARPSLSLSLCVCVSISLSLSFFLSKVCVRQNQEPQQRWKTRYDGGGSRCVRVVCSFFITTMHTQSWLSHSLLFPICVCRNKKKEWDGIRLTKTSATKTRTTGTATRPRPTTKRVGPTTKRVGPTRTGPTRMRERRTRARQRRG